MEESESMGYVSGSTVVEMSYIMPLILLMFVLIIHTVFYFYDRAVLNGAAAETAVGTSPKAGDGMRKKEVWIFKKIWKEDKKWILGGLG